jgi:hypothetical protein
MTREPANFGIQPTALHAAADAGAFDALGMNERL